MASPYRLGHPYLRVLEEEVDLPLEATSAAFRLERAFGPAY
jgi:hypothetical protein